MREVVRGECLSELGDAGFGVLAAHAGVDEAAVLDEVVATEVATELRPVAVRHEA